MSELDVDRDDRSTCRKRGLAACGLTCRYWASVMRPLLFATLTLRSAEDVAQLMTFLRSATSLRPTLPECIDRLDIEMQGFQTLPWIHHIHKLSRRINDLEIHLAVAISDDTTPLSDRIHPRTQLSALPHGCFPALCFPSRA